MSTCPALSPIPVETIELFLYTSTLSGLVLHIRVCPLCFVNTISINKGVVKMSCDISCVAGGKCVIMKINI